MLGQNLQTKPTNISRHTEGLKHNLIVKLARASPPKRKMLISSRTIYADKKAYGNLHLQKYIPWRGPQKHSELAVVLLAKSDTVRSVVIYRPLLEEYIRTCPTVSIKILVDLHWG